MLWEYRDLTVLPFFETWSAHIFGGWQRVCWCTNEAFDQASPTKEFWENCPQKKGGHIYCKNEGWAYLRKLLYSVLSHPGWQDSKKKLQFPSLTSEISYTFHKIIPWQYWWRISPSHMISCLIRFDDQQLRCKNMWLAIGFICSASFRLNLSVVHNSHMNSHHHHPHHFQKPRPWKRRIQDPFLWFLCPQIFNPLIVCRSLGEFEKQGY